MAQTALARMVEPDLWDSCLESGGDIDGQASVDASDKAAPAGITARLIRTVASFRKDRQAHFPGALGSETCWHVLLQLYAAHLDQHRMSIGNLTKRTGSAGTTVLRAIEALASAGLLVRCEDRFDRRRVFVELSDTGVAAMIRYLKSGSRAAFL